MGSQKTVRTRFFVSFSLSSLNARRISGVGGEHGADGPQAAVEGFQRSGGNLAPHLFDGESGAKVL